ncbi:Lipin/Ned1/Smp2-domain-containing protein [Scleroderma citrinum]
MNYLRGAVSAISAPYQYYRDINPSTLTGAIDVIVVRRPTDDGDTHLACSPFHVRFGKLQVLHPADKKVNVSVNGTPIPFSMKIGDAGEAFFVFETEDDIPEDLVTSPLLTATSTTPQEDIPPVALNPKTTLIEVPPRSEAKTDIPEPDFLDLNATPQDQTATHHSRVQSAPETPLSDDATQPSSSEGVAPDVQYRDDVALDMAGYHSAVPTQPSWLEGMHSHQRGSSTDLPSYESKDTESDDQIPFPQQHHNSSPEHPPRHTQDHDSLDDTTTSLHPQAYSWEWGAFPQPSPVQSRMNLPFSKGKTKAFNTTRAHDEPDDNERILTRSRSVPPELEASPHSVHTPLPSLDSDHGHSPPERSPSPHGDLDAFGSGGRLAALRTDPTKFRVSIDSGTTVFELSLVEGRHIFHSNDEVEAARVFETGLVDYHRFIDDDSVLTDERLVIKWNGGQYITREDGSPLMSALRIWRASSATDGLVDDSPSSTPSSQPQEEDSLASPEQGIDQSQRSGSEPPVPPSRQSTSSSWVRWWSRSSNIPDAERPSLREASTIPFGAKLPRSTLSAPRTHAPASAPPGTPAPPHSPVTKPVDMPVPTQTQTQKRYAKTLRLTSDQLKALDLQLGANTITFSLTTDGAPACTARIFVLESTDSIVVSDIDGTITKSDGLGHIFTMIGRDWTHSGVAKLYTDIARNGYKIMYLTSRAIGQADSTRDYLKGIKQNDYQLPEGPVIMSPDRLMASLHREVIMRKPEVFKMACLRDIQRLFGDSSRMPFYAGFGNRITDALSYRSVNVPPSRIFTIDSSSTVKMELLELAGYKSSYMHMTDLVDQMFPPIHKKWEADFTDFNYWKTPVQEFQLPDLTPPSPALSAKSDTSTQSTLARLRNFSIGGRQSVSVNGTPTEIGTGAGAGTGTSMGVGGPGEHSVHLRQMSSFERLSSRLAALTLSSSPNTIVGSGSFESRSSASSTFLDSDEDPDVQADLEGGVFKPRGRRPRSTSMASMPGSLDNDIHFGMDEEEDEGEDGDGNDEDEGDRDGGDYEEEAAEEAFDEDFLATGEMKNVPFL